MAMALAASIFAAPVQISVNPVAVRAGATADIVITWAQPMPAGATLQWTATAGDAHSDGAGGYVYVAPADPGRVFIHLAVNTAQGLWGECAVPVQVYRQFIILKADDFGVTSVENLQRYTSYIDSLASRGVKTSVGMIASGCVNPTADLRAKVTAWRESGLVEFFNHGYDHAYYTPTGTKGASDAALLGDDLRDKDYPAGTTYEFQGRPYAEQLDHLTRAQQTILDTYGFQMHTFGAPFNKIDSNTTLAVQALGQFNMWYFGPPDPNVYSVSRGGGEIEVSTSVPSLSTYTTTHDLTRDVVVLQHHPAGKAFHDNWSEFIGILEQIHTDEGTYVLPGEYADLMMHNMLPADPTATIADPSLECALRAALGQWTGTLDPASLAGLATLQWTNPTSKIHSLRGIGACGALRQLDLRGNNISDIAPLVSLWQAIGGEMTVQLQDNPLSDDVTCNELPALDAKGLHISATSPCDNVLLTLAVDGQGTLDPAAGDHAVPRNTTLVVHATPAAGWRFVSWEGAPEATSGSPVLSIAPSTHRSITAHFVKMNGFAVVVNTAANGTVAVTPAQPEDGYQAGTTVTVTATANDGYAFKAWTDDLEGTTANPATLVVDATKTVGAEFSVAPPANIKTAAQQLLDGFAAADTDSSGGLSFAEASAAVAGLTQDQFSILDVDADGQLTQDDLNQLLGTDSGGCSCTKSTFTLDGLKGRLADLFLSGLALMTLLAFSANKPRA